MNQVPYEMPPVAGLLVPANSEACFELDFPSRSQISKIIVAQTDDGPMVDFTVTLYNHPSACEGISLSASDPDTHGQLPRDMYVITTDIEGSAGRLKYFSEEANGGSGFINFNQEPAESAREQRGTKRKVYMRIRPHNATQVTQWAVVLGGWLCG